MGLAQTIQTVRISGASILFTLFFITMFEVIFYFNAVTGIEKDVTTGGIHRVTALMGWQVQQALQADPPLTPQQRTALLSNMQSSLDTILPRLQGSADAERHNIDQHNAPLKRLGYGLSGGVLAILAVGFFSYWAYTRSQGGARGYQWDSTRHALKEMGIDTGLLLAGFALYDFILFYFVVKYFQPISAGDYLATVFIPAFRCPEDASNLPAAKDNPLAEADGATVAAQSV